MDRRPPPPHEREWRHPAEISAEHRIIFASEPPSRRLRTAALISGSAALIIIGIAAWFVTAGSTGPQVASSPRSATRISTVLALPIQNASGMALVTDRGMAMADSADGTEDGLGMVSLPDGQQVMAQVRHVSGRLLVVSIEGGTESGFAIAVARSETTMTLAGDHPAGLVDQLVDGESFEQLSTAPASILDGTPVLDPDGNLIGLCSPRSDGVDVLLIDEGLLAALR